MEPCWCKLEYTQVFGTHHTNIAQQQLQFRRCTCKTSLRSRATCVLHNSLHALTLSLQVEDFEMDIAVDTEKLEIFGTIITEVKMEGRVPASSHLVYDCSHGEWLLAQMAYDRKIRLFSSRYIREPTWHTDLWVAMLCSSRMIFGFTLVAMLEFWHRNLTAAGIPDVPLEYRAKCEKQPKKLKLPTHYACMKGELFVHITNYGGGGSLLGEALCCK